ncbi:PREDICTED: uncharacterized protein LOC105448546 [Wasmannia auropunctata]|uniref:uncharacterized protein LOC105448546 n=1 Tax=Wasmannia auropunctata TaxID=64793 RepID=UPI0005EE6515|nr:PREDICTED: uncharacterized protein LOC105448546 [Wasmannia auropunctata]
MVYLRDNKRNLVKCRALLDTGATANFISESIVKRLRVPVSAHLTTIGAINSTNTVSKSITRINVQSTRGDFSRDMTCLVIPAIADLIPSEVFPRDLIEIPSNIKLADPDFYLPRPVDLLIGAGATLSLFSIGQINLSREGHDLYLQKTRLGWIVAGSAAPSAASNTGTCYLTRLEAQLDKFWALEEIQASKPRSAEEIECEAHFVRNTCRDSNGRYTVRLPFRETSKRLGDTRSVALKRFLTLERKFHANTSLKNEYTWVIEEYIKLNYISAVTDPTGDGYYMPHHAVIKESNNTTKVRVVFDASAKANNGVSLNDTLMIGPIIQDKLFAHLIRFRTYKYVINADIEKMYLQVRLHEDDRRYQRILWREKDEIQTFQFNTLTFGVSSSSFLAIRTLQQLADDERHAYPRAAAVLKAHLYVDDLLSGADSIDEARAIRDEIIALLARGGFSIRQWASNDERVIDDLASGALHASFAFGKDRSLKANAWHNVSIHTAWLEFVGQLELINQISVDRKLLAQDCHDVQFHGFCDASNSGYGACLYLRSTGEHENAAVNLLCAKSRVAPLKTITIPRLELCGALLLARLYREVADALSLAPGRVIFWCDSTVVLHWLNTSPHLLNPFVANRVAEIQKLTDLCEWRQPAVHVAAYSKVRQDFWARWSLEYLNELQIRNKWVKDGPKLEVGTVVLVKDKNLPCTQWALGRVAAVHPGEDGIVRAATIKTANGNLKRAARQLCPLPIES